MALEYKNQISFPVFGTVVYTKAADTITNLTATRTEWTLSASYETENPSQLKPTKAFATAGFTKLNLDISYTMGAAETTNSIELKIEGSPDGVNYYRIPNETTSAGTSTLTAREFTFVGANGANTTISIGLDIFYKFVKVSAKETGVSSVFGTAYCEATLSGV